MSVLNDFSNFVMDLYDVYSGITVSASTDNIIIKVDTYGKILLWLIDDTIYPQVIHDFDIKNAIDFDTMFKIFEVINKYT